MVPDLDVVSLPSALLMFFSLCICQSVWYEPCEHMGAPTNMPTSGRQMLEMHDLSLEHGSLAVRWFDLHGIIHMIVELALMMVVADALVPIKFGTRTSASTMMTQASRCISCILASWRVVELSWVELRTTGHVTLVAITGTTIPVPYL